MMLKIGDRQCEDALKHLAAKIHHHPLRHPGEAYAAQIAQHPAHREQRDQAGRNQERPQRDRLSKAIVDEVAQQPRHDPLGAGEGEHGDNGADELAPVSERVRQEASIQREAVDVSCGLRRGILHRRGEE